MTDPILRFDVWEYAFVDGRLCQRYCGTTTPGTFQPVGGAVGVDPFGYTRMLVQLCEAEARRRADAAR